MAKLNSKFRKLKACAETEFEKQLVDAVQLQTTARELPLWPNNFAYAARELNRHILERLSPDKRIQECGWYVPTKGARNEIARSDRFQYAVHGGIDPKFLNSELGISYKKEWKRLSKAIDKLNSLTHIQPHTLNIGNEKGEELVEETLTAVLTIFESMDDCREQVIEWLVDTFHGEVAERAIEDTWEGLYDFATHYSVESVSLEDVKCLGIDSEYCYFFVEASIDVELQWGSDGDRSRGDGMMMDASFPFTCKMQCSVEDLASLEVDEESVDFNTEEFEEAWRN